jgi:hypothetical protein
VRQERRPARRRRWGALQARLAVASAQRVRMLAALQALEVEALRVPVQV